MVMAFAFSSFLVTVCHRQHLHIHNPLNSFATSWNQQLLEMKMSTKQDHDDDDHIMSCLNIPNFDISETPS